MNGDPIDFQRVQRAISQRLYLTGASSEDSGSKYAYFQVEGSTGKSYIVTFNTERATCDCPDFSTRGKICKHIIFIIVRVLKAVPKNSVFLKWDIEKIHKLFKCLREKNNQIEESHLPNIRNSDCCICFEDIPIKPGRAGLIVCKTCMNGYHTSCISRWNKNSCPMCRSEIISNPTSTVDDCLFKLRIDL